MILMTTVNIFLVVMTNGTICCLNCLIIRYTKTWPIVVSMESIKKSMPNCGCLELNCIAILNWPEITA